MILEIKNYLRKKNIVNGRSLIYFGIILGILFFCYRTAIYFSNLTLIEDLKINFTQQLFVIHSIYLGIIALLLSLSLFGISQKKRWGIRLLRVFCAFVYIDSGRMVVLVNYQSLIGFLNIVVFVLSLVLLLICASKTINKEFEFRPGLLEKSPKWMAFGKITRRVLGIGLAIMITAYFAYYYYFSPRQRIDYPVVVSQDTIPAHHLLGYAFQTPPEYKITEIKNVFLKPLDFRMVFLSDEDKSRRIVLNMNLSAFLARMFHYRVPYEFHRRLSRLAGFIFKLPFLNKQGLNIVEVNIAKKYDGFLWYGDLKSGKEVYVFHIFDQNDRAMFCVVGFLFNRGDKDKEIIRQVLGTFDVSALSQKSAEDYLKEAQLFIEEGRYKDAQERLILALDQDWMNPEYHYQLALAFNATQNKEGMQSSLKEVIKLDQKYKDAKELLEGLGGE